MSVSDTNLLVKPVAASPERSSGSKESINAQLSRTGEAVALHSKTHVFAEPPATVESIRSEMMKSAADFEILEGAHE